MALRFIELPLLQRAPVSVYRYYSKTAAAHERSHPAEAPAVAQFDSPDVATAGKTTREVLRGWLVFKLFTYDYLVDNSLKLYGISKRLLGRWLTEKLMRATVFGHFAGGKDVEETAQTVRRLAGRGISSIWQYCIEQDISESGSAAVSEETVRLQEEEYERVKEYYLKDIEMSGSCNCEAPTRLSALKLTPIISPQLLMKINGKIVKSLKAFGDPSHQNDLFFQYLSRFKFDGFSELELEQIRCFVRRITTIAECASSSGVRVLVDAEQSYFQNAIHHFTVHYLMPVFNTHSPVVYNTLQTYLTSSFETLLVDLAAGRHFGFKYGVKLVRGAYMDKERKMAKQFGHPCPVHPDKPATDESYHRALHLLLGEVAEGRVEMVVASHNQQTVELALSRMQELSISPRDGTVVFGQLLGMADHLTYPLAQAGYIANKAVNYGSVDDMTHYLVRRGLENRGLIKNAQVERSVYSRELKRRLLSFKWR